jgi:hypothetical protein
VWVLSDSARQAAEARLATHARRETQAGEAQRRQCDDCETRLAAERQRRIQLEREVAKLRCARLVCRLSFG